MILYDFLSHLAGVTVKLQGVSMDIIKAYDEIEEVKSTYRTLLDNVDQEFSETSKKAVEIAHEVNVEPSMPRIVGHQTTPAQNPEEYYRVNVTLPFLSHIISELEAQFSDLSVLSAKMMNLIPSVLCTTEELPSLDDVVAMYNEDLPSPDLIRKNKFAGTDKSQLPSTARKAIKVCDMDMFPNIFTLLKIFITIPVTSCECERSASAIIHNYRKSFLYVWSQWSNHSNDLVKLFRCMSPSAFL